MHRKANITFVYSATNLLKFHRRPKNFLLSCKFLLQYHRIEILNVIDKTPISPLRFAYDKNGISGVFPLCSELNEYKAYFTPIGKAIENISLEIMHSILVQCAVVVLRYIPVVPLQISLGNRFSVHCLFTVPDHERFPRLNLLMMSCLRVDVILNCSLIKKIYHYIATMSDNSCLMGYFCIPISYIDTLTSQNDL